MKPTFRKKIALENFASLTHTLASEMRGPRCGWHPIKVQRVQGFRRAGGGKASHRPKSHDSEGRVKRVPIFFHPIGTIHDLGTGREWLFDAIGAIIIIAALALAWLVL